MTGHDTPRSGPVHPMTGAPMVLDETQAPDRLIERHKKGSMSPSAHERYAETVREKVEAGGLIYVDPVSGYRMRWQPPPAAAPIAPA